MLCVRCAHPLPPRADRCLRCFALNPDNRPGMLSQPLHDSAPVAPVAVSFNDTPLPAPRPAAEITEPDPGFALAREQVPETEPGQGYEIEHEHRHEIEPEIEHEIEHQHPREHGLAARLLAFSIDALLLCALESACILATLQIAALQYPLDFLRATLPLWLALFAALSFAYSLVFALASRTPGLALTGAHVESLDGGRPSLEEAAARAALSLVSALGLFGFAMALFDRRGQTLHDKLAGCVVMID